jgi:hypothetical protein
MCYNNIYHIYEAYIQNIDQFVSSNSDIAFADTSEIYINPWTQKSVYSFKYIPHK